jgi:APA family basic amino acid/polyamine antiporter
MVADHGGTGMKKTLSLTGVTINAMALIAPGAFLWITYQEQAAQTAPGGGSTAADMWPGLFFALILAFLTAISYAMLARRYPEAGTGSSYYFAERAFLERGGASARFARVAKFGIGWLSHLYYWVYPGVMVAFMATLIAYILGVFGVQLNVPAEVAVAVGFALLVGYIAFRGIQGSTAANILVNVLQIVMLVATTILALAYRAINPQHVRFVMPSLASIVVPHDFANVVFQGTIAILLLVGFESATALAAEAKHPSFVSKGVILSLAIQGLVMYLFEYFGAQAWINYGYTQRVGHTLVRGFAAAAASSGPIGDMVKNLGNTLLGGHGTPLMIVVAGIVGIAVLGTTLACLNTGVRVTYAMGRDEEVPTALGMLHGQYATPHYGVWLLTAVSAVVGAFGVVSVTNLTAVSFISNIGTFLLYGLTNVIALLALADERGKTPAGIRVLVPALGALANLGMLVAVFYLGILGGGATKVAALEAILLSLAWAVVGVVYFVSNSAARKRTLLLPTPEPGLRSRA